MNGPAGVGSSCEGLVSDNPSHHSQSLSPGLHHPPTWLLTACISATHTAHWIIYHPAILVKAPFRKTPLQNIFLLLLGILTLSFGFSSVYFL